MIERGLALGNLSRNRANIDYHGKEFLRLKMSCEEKFTQVFFNWKKNHFVLEG